MAVKIYQDSAWHELAGQKVYANGEWITLKNTDRIRFNNQWHFLGNVNSNLFAWGQNYNGQLGLGDTGSRNVPAQVGTATDWSSVASGSGHSLALKAPTT